MVVDSVLPHAEFGRNERREDESLFIYQVQVKQVQVKLNHILFLRSVDSARKQFFKF